MKGIIVIMKLIDFDDCELSVKNGLYGGIGGFKEGVIYDNEEWIIKYPKSTRDLNRKIDISYTSSPVSEYIGSQIYKILGFQVHETLLGVRNGKIVVACKDFTDETTRLLETRTIKNVYNKDIEAELNHKSLSNSSEHIIILDELMIHMEMNPIFNRLDNPKKHFYRMMVVDAYIKNNDRNNGNWGALLDLKTKSYRFAPVYDNGASFSPKLSDSRIKNILKDEKNFLSNARNIVTTFGFVDEKNEIHVLRFQNILNMGIPELDEAMTELVPLFEEKKEEIYNMIRDIPNEYKGLDVCSDIRKEFYIKTLDTIHNELCLPYCLAINNVYGHNENDLELEKNI